MYLYKHCNCKIFTINYKSTTCRTASLGAVTRQESKSQACTVQYTSNWSQSLFLILCSTFEEPKSRPSQHSLSSQFDLRKTTWKTTLCPQTIPWMQNNHKVLFSLLICYLLLGQCLHNTACCTTANTTILKSNFQHVFKVMSCDYLGCQIMPKIYFNI